VVWNTNELPDSLFTFVVDSTRLIKGFTEVCRLLREGDEIVAILPDSLAYGAKGAGDVIPPHATPVYDVFKVVSVEAPLNGE
jgi:FKBP-type peptidyl-prolyl cis-trans isomerase